MKPRSEFFLCLALLVVSFFCLHALEAKNLQNSPFQDCPDKQESIKTDRFPFPPAEGLTKIHFHYRDSSRIRRTFDCWVDSNYIMQEELRFGYPANLEVVRNELDQILTQRARAKALKSGLSEYKNITITHDSVDNPRDLMWKPKYSKTVNGEFKDWLGAEARMVAVRYFKDRGFELGKKIEVDYKSIGDEERDHVSDCYEKLVRHSGEGGTEEIVRMLLTSFQEMCVEFPLDQVGAMYKAGFWPPVTVLDQQAGDCDSKAVALLALWQRTMPQMMLFVESVSEEEKERMHVPSVWRPLFDKHALIGIEGIPDGDQESEVEGVRRFIYCEVSAPQLPGYMFFKLAGTWERKLCLTDNCSEPDRPSQGQHVPIHLNPF
ncbi:MAG TPA: hypothetical protein VFR03_10420 [Thermoanaerobaculia bacterium]|nr:hypothetical protein [Thermoanaerobaculia bacterium]